jgi:hypothetical protein
MRSEVRAVLRCSPLLIFSNYLQNCIQSSSVKTNNFIFMRNYWGLSPWISTRQINYGPYNMNSSIASYLRAVHQLFIYFKEAYNQLGGSFCIIFSFALVSL